MVVRLIQYSRLKVSNSTKSHPPPILYYDHLLTTAQIVQPQTHHRPNCNLPYPHQRPTCTTTPPLASIRILLWPTARGVEYHAWKSYVRKRNYSRSTTPTTDIPIGYFLCE